MAEPLFDLKALYGAIDEARQRRDLSWAALAREIEVSASTIRRFGQADDAEADGVLRLIGWLGTAPEEFVGGDLVEGKLLIEPGNAAGVGDGYVRVDMELVAKAMGDRRGAQGRTRTTIQTLVEAAQRSGQPVASLTRLSDI